MSTQSVGGRTHLVIGDSHHKPGISTERARWAARVAGEVRADVVIDMGDWHDMPSLCSYDKGKGDFGERRYREDIQVGIEARNVFGEELKRWNGRRAVSKQVYPQLVALIGNHENRIKRAVYEEPHLLDTIGLIDVKHRDWKHWPYQNPIIIDGIAYAHSMVSGIMGRPLGGEHPAYYLLMKKSQTCVVGHSHLFDYCERNRADGSRIHGLVAGCYFEHDEDYATPEVNRMWARGLVILRRVRDGTFDLEWRSIEAVKERYA